MMELQNNLYAPVYDTWGVAAIITTTSGTEIVLTAKNHTMPPMQFAGFGVEFQSFKPMARVRASELPSDMIYESSSNWNFIRKWGTTDGQWHIVKPANAIWHSVGLSYDGSATTNNPIFYIDAFKPNVVKDTTPAGTYVSLAAEPFRIGNRSAADLALDGQIAHFAVWRDILTDLEYFQLCLGMSPLLIRPQSLVGYWPLVGGNPEMDLSGYQGSGTVTGTKATGPSPIFVNEMRTFAMPMLNLPPPFKAYWAATPNLPILGTGTF